MINSIETIPSRGIKPTVLKHHPRFTIPELVPLNVGLAWELTGGLSEPSKMPCHGFSTPARRCNVGTKLREVPGSICEICYAFERGRYGFEVVQLALERRYEALMNEPRWTEAMVWLINRFEKSGYFRWFDSGDVPDFAALEKIIEVVRQTPRIKHWLPTKEYGLISQWVKAHGAFPKNLTVRLSAYMVNGAPPRELAKRLGVLTSGVKKRGFSCPASLQGNQCGECRTCWQKRGNVNYHKH
jgi:hypothetical protein